MKEETYEKTNFERSYGAGSVPDAAAHGGAGGGGHQDHCLCGKTHNSNITTHKADDLTAFANAKWMASYTGQLGVEKSSTSSSGKLLDEDGDYVILTTGYYYLSTTADNCDHSYVKSFKTIKIEGNVTICLNGKQIQKVGNTTGSVFEVPTRRDRKSVV